MFASRMVAPTKAMFIRTPMFLLAVASPADRRLARLWRSAIRNKLGLVGLRIFYASFAIGLVGIGAGRDKG